MPSKTKLTPEIKLRRKSAFVLLLVLIILLFVVALVLLDAYGIIALNLGKNSKQALSVDLGDKCSYIAGQLIHTINNADECALKCRSECYTLGASYKQTDFALANGTCNLCHCVCN
jgi:hypothetical protein